jgi:hypothetical protein
MLRYCFFRHLHCKFTEQRKDSESCGTTSAQEATSMVSDLWTCRLCCSLLVYSYVPYSNWTSEELLAAMALRIYETVPILKYIINVLCCRQSHYALSCGRCMLAIRRNLLNRQGRIGFLEVLILLSWLLATPSVLRLQLVTLILINRYQSFIPEGCDNDTDCDINTSPFIYYHC